METRYDKAGPEDYEELIDFANYVFGHAHGPHDFPALLPKLYKTAYFMDGIHYLAREEGRIKAAVGAYPLELEFSGGSLPGRGIGMVSVHPYRRSQGYMRILMGMALEDMKRDGVVFSCLGGQRQRYEYFGFTQAGSAYTFTCSEANITHTLGRQWDTGLSLKEVDADDTALLDQIYMLHQSKSLRCLRRRDRLFDILSSWKAVVLAIIADTHQGDRLEGYIIGNGGNHISEINMNDLSRLPEAVGLFLCRQRRREGSGRITISAGPHEGEKLRILSRFTENCSQSDAYQFAVFDHLSFLEPFLVYKAREQALPAGSFTFRIEDGPALRLNVNNQGEASLIPEDRGENALTLKSIDAVRFFCSPLEAATNPVIRNDPFLRCLLPLPLFFESADQV
ncbi:MAG: GNAT family N-acetyltransferase [Treponema sp.]|jgi:predicted N-acetyltransferase YhbS|nr:GNAT family N-acetyltransferase [Treponema sp.]